MPVSSPPQRSRVRLGSRSRSPDRALPVWSDEELLGHYRDTRRPEIFAEIFRRHSNDLGRYLSRYLGDPVLAEDVLQDTFLQFHTRCDLYQDGWPARAWLHTLAAHRAIDALRRARRLPVTCLYRPLASGDALEAATLVDLLAGDDPGPLEQLQESERRQWVRDHVARLSEPLRQALVLTYYQGLSYAEVAEVLGIPIGTVRSRLHNAIASLRTDAERCNLSGSC